MAIWAFAETEAVLRRAEAIAATGNRAATIKELRSLSIDQFGFLLWSLPDPRWPALSELLPAAPLVKDQMGWTGYAGDKLLAQSFPFLRATAWHFARLVGGDLSGRKVLDFGAATAGCCASWNSWSMRRVYAAATHGRYRSMRAPKAVSRGRWRRATRGRISYRLPEFTFDLGLCLLGLYASAAAHPERLPVRRFVGISHRMASWWRQCDRPRFGAYRISAKLNVRPWSRGMSGRICLPSRSRRQPRIWQRLGQTRALAPPRKRLALGRNGLELLRSASAHRAAAARLGYLLTLVR